MSVTTRINSKTLGVPRIHFTTDCKSVNILMSLGIGTLVPIRLIVNTLTPCSNNYIILLIISRMSVQMVRDPAKRIQKCAHLVIRQKIFRVQWRL